MNYYELRNKMKEYTEDDSQEYIDQLDFLIELAEERIFKDIPDLPLTNKSSSGTISQSVNILTISDNVRIVRGLVVNNRVLDNRKEDFLIDYWPDESVESTPKYYSRIDEDTIKVIPTPDSDLSYTLHYKEKPEALSATNTENWISKNLPDILLSAAMVEASKFQKFVQGMEIWDKKYLEAVSTFLTENYKNTVSNEFNNI